MKSMLHILGLASLCLAAGLMVQPVQAKVVTLTAETNKSILMAETPQTVYLRIGLKGCPLEQFRERPPVNVALVIDKSGSMSGEKIRKAQDAAILALNRLNAEDIVSVVLYDSEAEVLVPATKMTRREDIIYKIRSIQAGGSTALYAGVETGSEEVRKFQSPGRVNRIVLLSDGLANVGPQSPEALGRLGARLAEKGISVTTVGLGLGYNEDLMSKLAYCSDGGHYFAEKPDELASIFDHEFGRALSVVAQEVRIEIICGENLRPVRILGRNGVIKDRTVTLDMNHIYSEHEKYILLEVEVPEDQAINTRELANVRLVYRDMNADAVVKTSQAVDVRFTGSQTESDKSLNKQVMADVVEQLAIEQNEQATALRDEGKIEQAREVLLQNSAYLRSNAATLDSPALKKYAEENELASDKLDSAKWPEQRKVMRESQTTRRTQQ